MGELSFVGVGAQVGVRKESVRNTCARLGYQEAISAVGNSVFLLGPLRIIEQVSQNCQSKERGAQEFP